MGTSLLAGVALSFLLAQGAATVAPPALPSEPPAQPGAPSLDGESGAPPSGYAGVVPGPDARNPLPQPKSDPPRLVWTGFKMAGDGSELFLQTTRPVSHELGQAAARGGTARLTLVLRNCRIHMKNNARRMDTRFFATPVEEVFARQRRRDVEVIMTLEGPAAPTVRTEPGPDGTQFLVLTFPPGRAQRPEAPPIDERVAP